MKIFKNQLLLSCSEAKNIPIAISVAFYNNLRNFELMMAALESQTQQNFLLIISDDGSRPEVVEEIQRKLQQFSRPAMHIWHEDKGFRKNRMLNWAIYYSPVEYLIFVDQDCLPHPEFIRDHLQEREANHVLCGRRMELTPWQSQWLTPNLIQWGVLQKFYWLIALTGFWMKDNNFPKAFRIGSQRMRRLFNSKDRSIVGCNFSIHREDLLKINGFDFRYEAAGTGEDSDIDFRLGLIGIRRKPLVHSAIQYHVYHKLTGKNDVNETLFESVKKQADPVTSFGIQQQLEGQ